MSREELRKLAKDRVASKKAEEAKKISEIFKSQSFTSVTIGDKTCVLKGDGDKEEFNRCLDSAKNPKPFVTVQFGSDVCSINNLAEKDAFTSCVELHYEYEGDVSVIVGDGKNECTISDFAEIQEDPCFLGLSSEVQSFYKSVEA